MSKKTFYLNLKSCKFNLLKAINTQHHFKSFVKNIYQEQELYMIKEFKEHKLITQTIDTNSEIFATTKFFKHKDIVTNDVGTFLKTKFFIFKHKRISMLKLNVPLMYTNTNTDVVNRLKDTLTSFINTKKKRLDVGLPPKKGKKISPFMQETITALNNIYGKRAKVADVTQPAIIIKPYLAGYMIYYRGLLGRVTEEDYRIAIKKEKRKRAESWFESLKEKLSWLQFWKEKLIILPFKRSKLEESQESQYKKFLVMSTKRLKAIITRRERFQKCGAAKLFLKEIKNRFAKHKINPKFLPPIRVNLTLKTIQYEPPIKKFNFKNVKRRFFIKDKNPITALQKKSVIKNVWFTHPQSKKRRVETFTRREKSPEQKLAEDIRVKNWTALALELERKGGNDTKAMVSTGIKSLVPRFLHKDFKKR